MHRLARGWGERGLGEDMAVIRRTALVDLAPAAALVFCLAKSEDASWNDAFVRAVREALAPRTSGAGGPDGLSLAGMPLLEQVDAVTVRSVAPDGGSATLTLSLAPIFGDATWLTGLLDIDIPDDAEDLANLLRQRSAALQRVLALVKDEIDAALLRSVTTERHLRASPNEGSGAR